MHGRGHAWQGVCIAGGGVHGRGIRVAGVAGMAGGGILLEFLFVAVAVALTQRDQLFMVRAVRIFSISTNMRV